MLTLDYPKRSQVLTPRLVKAVVGEFLLPNHGVHGPGHWFRVRANGLCLAAETGADAEVVELFALFHDCGRRNDFEDPQHGRRGATLAARMCGSLFELSDERLEVLQRACRGHTSGVRGDTDDETVMTCWDADRLDLGRVGVTPDPRRLLTQTARSPELRAWAFQRSRAGW